MGLQTALARRIGVEDVNTTVATMTTTTTMNLHGLAADSRIAGGDSTRWRRGAAVIFALFAGAALAVPAERVTASNRMVVATLAVTAVAAVAAVAHRRARRSAAPAEPRQIRGARGLQP